jgi:chromosome segregation protein
MRLKQLELYGYKSFATRTRFDFGEGLTAIVGPNGSGKSNIADAVRWVMGEQSFSSLRAKTSEDMIFAGSRSRSRLGMAEVTLVIDNSDAMLPLAYSEVAVGRRAYRSGENDYLLNGTKVRYRDIVELLGGAGLARSSYTTIGQGQVDAALALRPEARRVLFEEAAGITPHLRRREETLRRIDETERNLERVGDLINELGPRARTLRRQAERAEEYMLLQQDLEELQRIWYGHQWQRRQAQLQRAEAAVRQEATHLDTLRQRAGKVAERRERIAQETTQHRQCINDIERRLEGLRSRRESLRREAAVGQERARLLRSQLSTLQDDLGQLLQRREVLEAEIASAREELASQQQMHASSAATWNQARAKLETLEESRASLQEEVHKREASLAATLTEHAQATARLQTLLDRQEELVRDQVDAEASTRPIAETIRQAQKRARQLSDKVEHLEAEEARLQAEREGLREQTGQTERALAQLEERALQARRQRDQLVSRFQALSRVQEEMSGYYPGVRAVLSGAAGLTGMAGTVASLMRVAPELEDAIEAALGARLQHIIAETWQDAERAIAYLKRSRAGWATFLPLDTIRSHAKLKPGSDAGIVGVASDLVRYDEAYRTVYELLLGRVLVTKDLSTARRLLRSRTGASLYVTLDGETVQPSGAVSGGSRNRAGSDILAQDRERRDLEPRVTDAEQQAESAQRELEQIQGELALLREKARALGQQRETLLKRLDQARAAMAEQQRELADLQRNATWHRERHENAERNAQETASRIAALQAQAQSLEQRRTELAEQLDAAQAELAACDDPALRRRVAELETRTAVAERTANSQRTLVRSHEANLDQLASQIASTEQRNAGNQRQIAELDRQNASIAERLEATEDEISAARQELEPAREGLRAADAKRQEIDDLAAESRERLNEAELAHHRAQIEEERAREALAILRQSIEEDLGPIDLPETSGQQLRLDLGDDVIELPEVRALPTGLGEDIRRLRARIRRLGNVNPNAPREYEQLLERQTFLQSQAADLKGAIAALHEIIQELDGIIEHDFTATFERVNEAFGTYFATLFGGGEAELSLTGVGNIAETGVEITARPPGKRQQGLSLLSGGERALTAVSLLFALLHANPVPFCFLDEVDAALDESNVGRFRELLRQHAAQTQFVVITHNRRTIEAAERIYGVSMSEHGVSTCVSLKLPEEVDASAEGFEAGEGKPA